MLFNNPAQCCPLRGNPVRIEERSYILCKYIFYIKGIDAPCLHRIVYLNIIQPAQLTDRIVMRSISHAWIFFRPMPCIL